MSRIYDKSTKELFGQFVNVFVPPPPQGFGLIERKPLSKNGSFTRKEILGWFKQHYPRIKTATVNAHLTVMSTNAPSRIHHTLRANGADDLLYQINKSQFRLYDPAHDPEPICHGEGSSDEEPPEHESEPSGSAEFAYEADLRNYLSKNLPIIEPGLKLYEDEEGINGIEFPAGGRFVDILAVDSNGDFVVIELKVSRGDDRVVGQLMRYMAWIRRNLADANQNVRGVIVAREISEDLLLACSLLDGVQLFEYKLSLTVKQVDTRTGR